MPAHRSRLHCVVVGGDQALASRVAHTVKGVAGNLGIDGVRLAAESVERAIREGSVPSASLLEEFDNALRHAAQAIRNELGAPAQQVAASAPRFDPEAASAAIARLKSLIEADDADAVDALQAVECALGGTVDKGQLDSLRGFVAGEFDFEAAGAEAGRDRRRSGRNRRMCTARSAEEPIHSILR